MKRLITITIFIITAICVNTVSAQTKIPDKSILINSQTLLDQYVRHDNAAIPRCITGKPTVMITTVPHCPPSRFYKMMVNRFLYDNDIQDNVIVLYVHIEKCDMTPFKQITDDEIILAAPYILVFDKNGNLNMWCHGLGHENTTKIKESIMQVK